MTQRVERSLTILLITNNYRPYSGGVVSSIDVLYRELKNMGHRPYIVTLDFTPEIIDENKDVIRVPSWLRFKYKGNHMALPWRIRLYLKMLITQLRVDVIHVNHPFLLGSVALKIGRKLHIPVFFTYHTRYELYLHYIPLPSWISYIFLYWRLRFFCNRVDLVIFPRKFLAQEIKKKYRLFNKYTILPSAISDLFFKEKKSFRLKSTKWTLISVSRFTKEKNLYFLLRVIKILALDCITLQLIGYGSELESLKIYAYTALRLSAEQVVFIIKPNKEFLLKLYNQAHIFLFSSMSETQGLVLSEALSSGLPVIAFDAPAQRECIQEGINGFLVKSETEMAEKIKLLISDNRLYQYMQRAAIQSASIYHPKHYAEKMVEIYQA